MEKEIYKEIKKSEALKQSIMEKRGNIEEKKVEGRSLICRKTKGGYQYCVDRKYVSKVKKLDYLREIARQEYWEKLLPILDSYTRQLRTILKTRILLEEAYSRMHEGKQVLFEPDFVPISKRIQDFNNVTCEGLPFSETDKTEYFTHRGERVRSKSEKIIADELDRHGIPYHYEMTLQLRVDGQMKEFHPDFTAMNITTGEIKYIEHLGMMDNPNYYGNALAKLDAYERNGLLIGRDVLLLHESAYRPLNTRIISDYIHEFLM